MTLLPEGFGIELDRSVRRFCGGSVLAGGHPGRLVSLSPDGLRALDSLLAGAPPTTGGRRLGARLVAAGMAHPRPPVPATASATGRELTVVVPVRDRLPDLDRCLASLVPGPPVVVVDDGSEDPAAVAEVCRRHGARLVLRPFSGGPGAARNDGLDAIGTDLVAFVDSDCSVTPGWLDPLVALLEDPSIGAVAPRVRRHPSAPGARVPAIDRYSDSRSPLDLGPDPSEVGPDRLVRYVPTAAMVARTAAVADGFDPDLQVGEDVDLVWRILGAGWRVRYEPSVTVHHREPARWGGLLRRRFRYGTSAGPLARRHHGALAPVELRPWPTAVAAAVLAGRPRVAAVTLMASTVAMHRDLGSRRIPVTQSLRWSLVGAGWTLIGLARATTMLAPPVIGVAALRSRRGRLVATLAVVAPPAVEWWRRRPRLDPLRWTAASVADDAAYGCGVWAGCLAARTLAPVVPAVRRARPSAPGGPTPVGEPMPGRTTHPDGVHPPGP